MKNSFSDVLILSTIEGHASIASAIQQGLNAAGISNEIYTFPDPAFHVYRHLYRYLPSSTGFLYQMTFQPQVRKIMRRYTHLSHMDALSKAIKKVKPRLIISTSFGFDATIETRKIYKEIPYINILTDPRTFTAINVSSCARMNCVFDSVIAKKCHSYDKKSKAVVTGWFVRDEYQAKYDQKKVRLELGLDADKLMFLICSGSEGTNSVTTILPTLLSAKVPIDIVVSCGSNVGLRKSIKTIAKLFHKINPQVRLIPLEFTPYLHKYMQAADLIIGKAGPNTIFEAVATRTPFFAITHIAGQEDGNLDLIRQYKLGYVEENPFKASKILHRIIAHPEKLQQFQSHLEQLALYNKQAKPKIVELVLSQLPEAKGRAIAASSSAVVA
jgi:processive 1,2-diacylglycerol beta-glucosyltransferase